MILEERRQLIRARKSLEATDLSTKSYTSAQAHGSTDWLPLMAKTHSKCDPVGKVPVSGGWCHFWWVAGSRAWNMTFKKEYFLHYLFCLGSQDAVIVAPISQVFYCATHY